ncbi:MAG: DHH family phosphoesterase [Lachnospiraceae bacterium]|nr:DHH family phosphoesterase [Lachnospiraceae bacterium]
MEKIYIIGHRNPDFDSVCSAYAYAKLKNRTDPLKEYIAARCGHLPESMKKVFAGLGIEPPVYMRDIYPKVRDIYLTSAVRIDADAPLSTVAASYKATNPSVIPVFEGEKFYGLLSVDDITRWAMEQISKRGKIDEIPKVRDIMRAEEEPVSSSDFFEDAKRKLSSSIKRGLAVVENGTFVGFVTRRCFLKAPKNNIILVDHNEAKQSITGIETANIVEIIDHHRLDAVKTELPIFIDAEPLGSTCTIVYRKYVLEGITPDQDVAKMLLTGIVSDTLILRSPTTTPVDIESANDLAKIIGVDLHEFGLRMFSCMEGMKNRVPKEAVESDFKTYREKNLKIGIGQCECTTLEDLEDYRQDYLAALEDVRKRQGLDWAVLMITDVIREHSVLLITEFRAGSHLPYSLVSDRVYDMPGVMSRKKQLLPEILHAVGE